MFLNSIKIKLLKFYGTMLLLLLFSSNLNAQLIGSLKAEKEQIVISVQDNTDTSNISAAELYRELLISIENKSTELKTIVYEGPIAKLNKIEYCSNNKALIIGELPYLGTNIIVVDIEAGKVLDTIRAYQYSISPSNSVLAYTTWYPRLGSIEMRKSIILAYDLKKLPTENRLPLISNHSYKNAGFPIFPEKNASISALDVNDLDKEEFFQKKYDVSLDEEYIMMSPFLWSNDDKQLVFFTFNKEKNTNYLVHIDFTNGVENPSIYLQQIILDQLIKENILLDETKIELSEKPYKFAVNNLSWVDEDTIDIEPYPQYWLDKGLIMKIPR